MNEKQLKILEGRLESYTRGYRAGAQGLRKLQMLGQPEPYSITWFDLGMQDGWQTYKYHIHNAKQSILADMGLSLKDLPSEIQ